MQAYLQPGSAGWIIWSLKMEGGGIWSLKTCYDDVRFTDQQVLWCLNLARHASHVACGLSCLRGSRRVVSPAMLACRTTQLPYKCT